MRYMASLFYLAALMGLECLSLPAREVEREERFFKAMGAPAHPSVEVSWNRYHDTDGLAAIFRGLQKAYPDLTRFYSLGMSHGGRQIWCLEVTHRRVGDPRRKPGLFVSGNIHGDEVQTGEAVAYTGWYLCESFWQNERIRDLLNAYVFYLVPSLNPDGRDYYFHTPDQLRSGIVPLDNDRDGLTDEDGPDDLNGDGQISLMRIRDPNGRWKKHPDYPELLMVPAKEDERGEYTILGMEGIDNDGDGEINEDGVGGYDSNRNFAWDWQPGYVQYGAIDFPFSLPNTHAVARFVLDRPNIAASQSYHNSGGMVLRGPERDGGEMQPSDARLLEFIGDRGAQMLPFYESLISWKDLYPTLGDEAQWLYGARGIFAFCNELWTDKYLFHSNRTGDAAQAEFNKHLLLGEAAMEWREFDHPTYGKIEIGGWKKEIENSPPSFLIEEELHRNMAFTLYNAANMPRISFGDVQVEAIGENLYKIGVEVRNGAMLPTRSGQDIAHTINHPDIVSLKGGNAKVVSSGRVVNRYFKKVEPVPIRPERVEVECIPGLDSIVVQFIVAGRGTAEIAVDSVKGGMIKKNIVLK